MMVNDGINDGINNGIRIDIPSGKHTKKPIEISLIYPLITWWFSNSFLSNYQTVFDNPTWMVWCGFVWNSGVPTGSSSSSPSKWPEWEDSHFQIWTFHHLNLQILCSQNWMMGQFTGNPMVKTWSFRCRFSQQNHSTDPWIDLGISTGNYGFSHWIWGFLVKIFPAKPLHWLIFFIYWE